MFDIQHDSPTPIHEQITSQIRAHIASGALMAGATLAEARAFAQQVLANPHVVVRAYDDLEIEGVLKKLPTGQMIVTPSAYVICRSRVQETAREKLAQAITLARSAGLSEDEVVDAVKRELAAAKIRPLTPQELQYAIKKPTHESSHRASQGIQDLSRQSRPG